MEFDIPIGKNGDCYDRYVIRMEEMRQSVRIMKQCLEKLKTAEGAGPVSSVDGKIVPPKRGEMKLPPVAKTGKMGINPRGQEPFDFRQPQHIVVAGAMGLGVADLDKIEHRRIALT